MEQTNKARSIRSRGNAPLNLLFQNARGSEVQRFESCLSINLSQVLNTARWVADVNSQ